MSARNAYLVSSVGHAGVLALGFALASLVRAPAIVPGVRIVLGGGGAPAGGPKHTEVRARTRPTPPEVKPTPKPEPEVAPPPVPRPKPVEKAPPERVATKPAEVRGTKPARDAGIVSKAPSEVAAATTAAARSEDSVASLAGAGGQGEVGIEAEGDAGPAAGYLALLRERVANSWEPPAAIERSGEARTVVVFTVSQTGGRPEGLEVQSSSGVALFDRRAMAAVADAAPLPPIPAHLGYGSIVIRFTFTQAY